MVANAPTIHIKRFFAKYRPDRSDPSKMAEEHWVEYGPVGSLDKSLTGIRVKDLKPREPISIGNPSSEMGWMRWEIIEKAYKRFLDGHEVVTEGTPLAAWNGLMPEQAEVLRSRGIKTVEEVAKLTDAHIERIPLPMRELIRNAKLFLSAQDNAAFQQTLAEKDAKIAALEVSDSEKAEQISALIGKVDQLATIVSEQQAISLAKTPKRKVAA